MSKELYLFTLKGCSHCSEVKQRLKNEGITYFDVDIDQFDDLWNIMVEETNQEYVPVLYIKDTESEYGGVYVPDTDFTNIDELFEIIYDKKGNS